LYQLDELTMSEKFILSAIANLDKISGCTSKNTYFIDLFGFSKITVERSLSKLKRLGYISVKLSNRNNNRLIRVTYPQNDSNAYPQNEGHPPPQNEGESKGIIKEHNILPTFENIWKKYQLNMKRLGRRGGNKLIARERFIRLSTKYKQNDIVNLVGTFYGSKYPKDLENVLKEKQMLSYLECR